ncbi:MAG: hypothetical protein LBN92_05080, partial [Treponema sp.]|nr:hypothetical protein [Treponema sp.]
MDDRRKMVIIGGCAVLVLAGALLFFLTRGNGGGAKRDNTLLLAREYIDKGEFQRALDLVDGILIENPGDEEARALRDEAVEGKRLAELRRQDGSSLSAEEIARLLAEYRAGSGTLSLADVERILALRDAAAARAREDAAVSAAAETPAGDASSDAAEAKAAAEAAAARKKAEAEELAKASGAVQARMREVNELVARGRDAVGRGDFAAAEQAFNEALAKMPQGETRFEAQK